MPLLQPLPVATADAVWDDTAQPDAGFNVAAGTHAFFLDVDGSLIDIAAHPDLVEIPQDLPRLLRDLSAASGGAVALVSGRTVGDLDHLLAPLRLPAAGAHGAELRLAPQGPVRALPALDPALAAAVAKVARAFEGVFAEDKGTAIAVHHRAVPALAPRLREALAALVAEQAGLTILPGHGVFEIKRAGHDKGTAVAAFMAEAPFAGRVPVFIGDDVTDEAGFAAVAARGGLALAVGTPRAGAHGVLAGPSSVRAFLSQLEHAPLRLHRQRIG